MQPTKSNNVRNLDSRPKDSGDPLAQTGPASTSPPSPTSWRVIVFHSPFELKNAVVEAATADEAKQKFIAMAKEHSDAKIAKQEALQDENDRRKDAVRRRESFARAVEMANKGELKWLIRPEAEDVAQRQAIKEAQARIWGPLERMSI